MDDKSFDALLASTKEAGIYLQKRKALTVHFT
ncbi:MAG: Unknown protein [uncultured Sulfurovum sp.]|uniref:Uncharacterized protein n=1 Tax=uncultured Sulfurovum sp. TaxID=269237 RepID=A0A6S6U2C3_9BACT|nr:MAG: Unknown protein [uncultured Sulfurovum sp.]